MSAPVLYLIGKRGLWYRPGACGYTSNVSEAGRFDETTAFRERREVEGVYIRPVSEMQAEIDAARTPSPAPAVPGMWWPVDDPEKPYDSPEDWASDAGMLAGDTSTLTFQTATRGPNITVTITAVGNDETDDVEYRVTYEAPTTEAPDAR